MATVYLARQLNMNRQVAIKILPRVFLHDPQFIERFKREVQLIAELEHPHILPVYDFGEHEGIPFIVMRYLAGGSLRDQLNGGLPPLKDLRRPIEQLCSALDFAHGEGIIHRDLKPSNVMLDDHGNAYLSDFGIAQIMQDAGRLTGSAVIGTPAYMSPEQAEGRPLDARSDVYALGVVLFEMITGREPYRPIRRWRCCSNRSPRPMPSPRAYRPDPAGGGGAGRAQGHAQGPGGALSFRRGICQGVRGRAGRAVGRAKLDPAAAAAFGRADLRARPGRPGDGSPGRKHANRDRRGGGRPPAGSGQNAAAQAASVPAEATRQGEPTAPVAARRGPVVDRAGGPAGGRPGGGRGAGRVGRLSSGPATPFPTAAPPTPFPGADTYRGPRNVYQISVPGGWQKQDFSSGDEVFVLWAAPDGNAYAALRMVPAGEEDAAGFNRWIEAHTAAHYDDPRYFTPIDRASQPDGSLRVSFRLPQPGAIPDRFGPGQLDLFYSRQGAYDVVVEVFTADGGDLEAVLPSLQAVLASVYIPVAS
jgi:hypothetical protein